VGTTIVEVVVVGAVVVVVDVDVVVVARRVVVDAASDPPPRLHAARRAMAATRAAPRRGRMAVIVAPRSVRDVATLVPACVWRLTPELIVALDRRFGEPTDAYVNGSQVWLRDDGPGEVTLEWRLHPVPSFRRPPDVGVHDLFASVAFALTSGDDPPAAPDALWEGLEVFPAYGDEVEPAPLAAAATDALGIAPDASGLVDHQRLGDVWEQAGGRVSLVEALLEELRRPGDGSS
jgi:hypothetical protein